MDRLGWKDEIIREGRVRHILVASIVILGWLIENEPDNQAGFVVGGIMLAEGLVGPTHGWFSPTAACWFNIGLWCWLGEQMAKTQWGLAGFISWVGTTVGVVTVLGIQDETKPKTTVPWS